MSKRARVAFGLVYLLLAFATGAAGSVPCQQQGQRCPEPARSPFRYVITYNDEVDYHSSEGEKGTFRVVEILLDSESFSEPTLRQLFELIAKRFPKSDRLFVHVHTSLDDVYTPEEVDQLRPPAQCASLPGDRHPWAVYNRNRNYEGFDYGTGEPGAGMKTVKLRGVAK